MAPSHWSDQMTAWCKSRWWCWDCLVLFRGGMGMAQRFSAWLTRDKLLPEQQAWAITVLAGGPATPIQPQRMYNKIQARPAGKQHTGSTSKEINAFFFSQHISERRYIDWAFNVKHNSKSRTKQIHEPRKKTRLVPTGVYLGMSLIVNLRWQHGTPEFPSYWDNLNDNVICHFVHKVIYPLAQKEVWGRRLLGALMSLLKPGWWHEPFQCAAILCSQQDKVKIFPFKGLNQA